MELSNNEFLERLKPHLPMILLSVAGVVFVVIGTFQALSPISKEGEIVIEKASSQEAGRTTEQVNGKIFVDVSGAVAKPGVYELRDDARIQDALVAAGGMSHEADREQVARTINLAAKVTDGQKLYVPFQGESTLRQGSAGQAGVEGSETININTASDSQLDSLPGVGEVTAGKIIAGRPYQRVEELQEKKIVNSSTYEKIKEKISVY